MPFPQRGCTKKTTRADATSSKVGLARCASRAPSARNPGASFRACGVVRSAPAERGRGACAARVALPSEGWGCMFTAFPGWPVAGDPGLEDGIPLGFCVPRLRTNRGRQPGQGVDQNVGVQKPAHHQSRSHSARISRCQALLSKLGRRKTSGNNVTKARPRSGRTAVLA